MLLIGSRAIRFHLPEFREPVDWDLVGDTEDIRRLDTVLERRDRERRIPAARLVKAHYEWERSLVEVANADRVPYWRRVLELFADAPTLDAGLLGTVRVASLDYLLLTKQCGLVYGIVHWHKNLEDVYFLREHVLAMPEAIAELWPLAVRDSARMFARGHRRAARKVGGCHPGCLPLAEQARHPVLHELLALGPRPRVAEVGAWEGFPEASATERRGLMIELLAEEAMVVAAERRLGHSALGTGPDRPADDYLRAALRALIVGSLPLRWRYFAVNHYREIRAAVPPDWAAPLARFTAEAAPELSVCATLGEDQRCHGRGGAPPRDGRR